MGTGKRILLQHADSVAFIAVETRQQSDNNFRRESMLGDTSFYDVTSLQHLESVSMDHKDKEFCESASAQASAVKVSGGVV